jgi:hypothetical protein
MPGADRHDSTSRHNGFLQRFSRRDLFSTLLGSAAVFGAALSLGGIREALAQAKTSKKVAKYQDHPNKGKSCSMCNYFLKPASCQLVAGTIYPTGWCSFFAQKKA